MLALVELIDHFRYYLLGCEFLVWTDHQALKFLLTFCEPQRQGTRLLKRFKEYMSLMWNIHPERNMEMQMQCQEGLDLNTNIEAAHFTIQMIPNDQMIPSVYLQWTIVPKKTQTCLARVWDVSQRALPLLKVKMLMLIQYCESYSNEKEKQV